MFNFSKFSKYKKKIVKYLTFFKSFSHMKRLYLLISNIKVENKIRFVKTCKKLLKLLFIHEKISNI